MNAMWKTKAQADYNARWGYRMLGDEARSQQFKRKRKYVQENI